MSSALDSLTPEQLQQILRLGTLNQQDQIIEEEMQRAMGMGKPTSGEHSTALGAALGGIGDVVRGVGSELRQKQLRGQQQANLSDEEKGRMMFAQLLRSQQQPAPPATPASAPAADPWTLPDFRYGM